FPSLTGAAKAAIAMQEALRLVQLTRGDERLAIRIVIARPMQPFGSIESSVSFWVKTGRRGAPAHRRESDPQETLLAAELQPANQSIDCPCGPVQATGLPSTASRKEPGLGVGGAALASSGKTDGTSLLIQTAPV